MRNILVRPHLSVLQQFAWSNVCVAFDYDGTLAPIVTDPARANMREATRRLLMEVARAYPCIVISGRAQGDALRKLRGVGLREVIGNHGAEPWASGEVLSTAVARWLPILERKLGRNKGVVIENKTFSVAVHYRLSREKRAVRQAIMAAVRELGEVRMIGGKQVVNIIPAGAPHKGTALEKARARLGCDTAIYVGDDDTDEDVFRLDQPGRLLTIRVRSKQSSMAHYCVSSQREIDDLLLALRDLRARVAQPVWA
jgi:trehalose 6-phosphate phosphatase